MDQLYIGRGKDEDNASLLAFLDEVFFDEAGNGTHFLTLLPKIYKDQYRPARNNFVVQEAGGAFRAAIGNFDNDMTVGGVDLKTCCIGNVAVGKAYRSMGYMIELMNASLEDMKQRGVALSYLGGQRQRYGYFGYENAGTCYNFVFSVNSLRHALHGIESGLTMEKLSPDDREAIRFIDSLYTKAPVISRRAPEAYFDILCSWEDIPYLVKENGAAVGYAVLSDRLDHVCEFGLADSALLPRFVSAVLSLCGKDCVGFTVAPFETEKLDFFSKNGSWMKIDHCESVCVLDFKTVLTAYLRAKASCSALCDGEMTVLIHGKAGDECLKLAVSGGDVRVEDFAGTPQFELDCLTAVRAFFSNYPTDRAAFPPAVQQWLPLPMFFSSRDTM